MECQESVLFVFINMPPKTHQALFIRRLSGSGFKVQGLAMPTFQFKRSYKEFSNTYEFTQWMIVAADYKQTAMNHN
jgi:hypothetical protein